MNSRPAGGAPSAADPLDEPVELSRLLSGAELEELAISFSAAHGCGVAITDRSGAPLAVATGAGAEVIADELSLATSRRTPIEYLGEAVGAVITGAGARDAELGSHIARIVELLLHHAHARRLVGLVHEAAMASSVAELTAKNRSLENSVVRLRETDRVKSNFLATMSHELRTPLTSVIGYSEMLLEGLAGPLVGEQRDYVATILSKADQLLQLITSVLDMSRASNNLDNADIAPVSMAELVESVVASFEPLASKRGIHLARDVEPLLALGDRRQVRQAVWHLVSNAVKFADDKTEVAISVRTGLLVPSGAGTRPDLRIGIHVAVSDRGIGIEPGQLAHIFEPFFQVDSSSTRQYGGTGLGLALAKAYVEAHGGRIWVDSTPGHGSTFVASFPLAPADGPRLQGKQL